MPIQRQKPVQKRAADCFVHGVMSANVFTNDFQAAAGVENRGCVNSTCARKITLVFSQDGRKRKQSVNVDPDV